MYGKQCLGHAPGLVVSERGLGDRHLDGPLEPCRARAVRSKAFGFTRAQQESGRCPSRGLGGGWGHGDPVGPGSTCCESQALRHTGVLQVSVLGWCPSGGPGPYTEPAGVRTARVNRDHRAVNGQSGPVSEVRGRPREHKSGFPTAHVHMDWSHGSSCLVSLATAVDQIAETFVKWIGDTQVTVSTLSKVTRAPVQLWVRAFDPLDPLVPLSKNPVPRPTHRFKCATCHCMGNEAG